MIACLLHVPLLGAELSVSLVFVDSSVYARSFIASFPGPSCMKERKVEGLVCAHDNQARDRKVIIECGCNSQTTSEGSESTLLVANLHSPFVPQT